MADGIKRRNPALVVSTNNTRVVPNRGKATLDEIEAFKNDLRKEAKAKAKIENKG